jgi:tetratricopeptide (TPR) repeat protein
MCNPAVRLLGHIALDPSQPRAAFEAYQETLTARLKHSDPNSPIIADVYDSIACAYTEIGDVSNAFAYLDKAKAIHLANDPNRMARTSAIYAMTYLRSGQPDQALKAIQKCWELQGLTEEQIAASQYPSTAAILCFWHVSTMLKVTAKLHFSSPPSPSLLERASWALKGQGSRGKRDRR